jgi:hypothetical protein
MHPAVRTANSPITNQGFRLNGSGIDDLIAAKTIGIADPIESIATPSDFVGNQWKSNINPIQVPTPAKPTKHAWLSALLGLRKSTTKPVHANAKGIGILKRLTLLIKGSPWVARGHCGDHCRALYSSQFGSQSISAPRTLRPNTHHFAILNNRFESSLRDNYFRRLGVGGDVVALLEGKRVPGLKEAVPVSSASYE